MKKKFGWVLLCLLLGLGLALPAAEILASEYYRPPTSVTSCDPNPCNVSAGETCQMSAFLTQSVCYSPKGTTFYFDTSESALNACSSSGQTVVRASGSDLYDLAEMGFFCANNENFKFRNISSVNDCGPDEDYKLVTGNVKGPLCYNISGTTTVTSSLQVDCSQAVADADKGMFTKNVSNECLNCGKCTQCDIMNVVINIAAGIFDVIGAMGVTMLVIGGVIYMVSLGNPQRIEQAKSAITVSVIGLIIIFSAYMIVGAVIKTLGYSNEGSWYNPSLSCPAWSSSPTTTGTETNDSSNSSASNSSPASESNCLGEGESGCTTGLPGHDPTPCCQGLTCQFNVCKKF